MNWSTTWLRVGVLLVVFLVVLVMAYFMMNSTDPVPAAAAKVDHANPTLVSKEISNGVYGGYAKVTFVNPKNVSQPIVVELRRPAWSRDWQPLAEE
jgi:hypothetical protein